MFANEHRLELRVRRRESRKVSSLELKGGGGNGRRCRKNVSMSDLRLYLHPLRQMLGKNGAALGSFVI